MLAGKQLCLVQKTRRSTLEQSAHAVGWNNLLILPICLKHIFFSVHFYVHSTSFNPDWRFGTWILFFHILGIIIPTDSYFSEGLKPPTRTISSLNFRFTHWGELPNRLWSAVRFFQALYASDWGGERDNLDPKLQYAVFSPSEELSHESCLIMVNTGE